MGADAWDRLKQAIIKTSKKHKEKEGIDVVTQFKFTHHFQDHEVEVIVQVRTDDYRKIEASKEILDELITHITNAVQRHEAQRIAVIYDDSISSWRYSYILLQDNSIIVS